MSVQTNIKRERFAKPENLKKGGAEAGIMAGAAAGTDGPSLVEIAIWNEFGTERKKPDGSKVKHIPARPFVGETLKNKGPQWKLLVARVNKLILAGKITVSDASGILGLQMEADIRQTLIDWTTPGNAPATIKKKGDDNPLEDEGDLKAAVKYRAL